MRYGECDVAVIGGGPAGLAAATAAAAGGVSVCLFEREEKVGGILKQCIHDGFGLIRYGEKLSGPEYAYREYERFRRSGALLRLETFLTAVEKNADGFLMTLTDAEGILKYRAKSLIAACGCRERTDRQVMIQGPRPAGIFTAGQAQAYINTDGHMPARRCVILGSGDIGLIMARRLTLEGAEVVGVYEIKYEPAGLSRNIAQCLTDFSIPLHLGCTVSRVVGQNRVEGVYTVKTDKNLMPVPGTEEYVPCDTLVLSVGLIPENDAFDSLCWKKDSVTSGPCVDSCGMTSVPGVFSCGNSLHVCDLVDYVSESGESAGRAAADWVRSGGGLQSVTASAGSCIGSLVPQSVALQRGAAGVDFFFRSRETLSFCRLSVTADGKEIFSRRYETVRPPEMEKVTLSKSLLPENVSSLVFSILPDETGAAVPDFFGCKITDETVCIECPRGCRLRIGRREDGSVAVFGNSCPKGKAYGEKETENPHRVLTTTVKTVFAHCPRLAVRTDGGIPRDLLKEAARMTSGITVGNPVVPGDILVENFGGWGVNLIAASECHP
ncbi:MAG: FAD-dependent oxidoreductase [Spirochaetia bacterium]|nr:FAD-dependent oxidoreductase [Spirochaetia bacterium]